MKERKKNPVISLILIRLFDLFFSILAIVFFSPLLVVVVIVLRFSGEGEVFFRQVRIGKGGREFYLLKFATMKKDSPFTGAKDLTLPNDPRVLPSGRLLRKSKLNELPQLLNVIKGDISLIGPRPQTKCYYECFSTEDRVWIDKIRPGLSGVGSIIFRDEESLLRNVDNPVIFDFTIITPYKGVLEKWFAMNLSLSLYFELIFTTVLVVVLPASSLHHKLMKRVPSPPPLLKAFLK